MANGRIELRRGDEPSVEVEWTGTRATGEATLRRLDDEDDDTIRDLRRAIADRRDLARVRFTTPRGSVPGWRGFDGYLAALTVTVPALGLDVWAVEWPDQAEM